METEEQLDFKQRKLYNWKLFKAFLLSCLSQKPPAADLHFKGGKGERRKESYLASERCVCDGEG